MQQNTPIEMAGIILGTLDDLMKMDTCGMSDGKLKKSLSKVVERMFIPEKLKQY